MNASGLRYDLHTHSTFSDGSPIEEMVAAAVEAGLEGVGISDHCIVVNDKFGRRDRYDLVETYEQRREEIDAIREDAPIAVFDAVEISYVPWAEAEIREFLATADFEYVIGSIHFAGPYGFTQSEQYAHADEAACQAAVDRYYEAMIDLIESELFDIVGHLDLPQRLPPLRGFTRPRHVDTVGAALSNSRSVPEINAGRLTRAYGEIHPEPTVLATLRDRGIEFTIGTDAHRPVEIRDRIAALDERGLRADIDLVGPP